MRAYRFALAFSICLLFALQSMPYQGQLQPPLTAWGGEVDQPPTISIDQPHGLVFEETVVVTGVVWDEALPSDVHWQLEKSGEIELQGSVLDSLTENLSWASSENRAWHWAITFNISSLNPCACTLVVYAVDQAQQVTDDSVILFGRNAGGTVSPHLLIDGPKEGQQWRGTLNLTGVAAEASSRPLTIEWATLFSPQASHSCTRGHLAEFVGVDEWTSASQTIDPLGRFDVVIETTDLVDGWHLVVARVSDGQGNNSATACTFVALHNLPPIAVITGPSELNESALAHFDASNSDDPVWGKDGLRFTFIVQSNKSSFPPEVHDLGETRSWGWYANQSGTFDVKVLVTDTSGLYTYSNTTVVVHNIAPVAAASVEGTPFNSDIVIRLPDTTHWTVDASLSIDTANDLGGLDYLWYIDGEPKAIGREQVIRREWIGDERVAHLLTLKVTDDDGESDWVEVFIGIEGTPSDPLWVQPASLSEQLVDSVGGNLNMLLIFMLVLVGITALTMRLTIRDRTSDIPRWVSKGKKSDIDDAFDEIDEEDDEPVDDEVEDTTDEEESAEG
jgi:hypothetical protein